MNKVILLGNLTRDPQLSFLPSQTAVVEFGIATNRKWKGKDGTENDETCFVDCKMFGKRAEVINQYCSKGGKLLVEGRLVFESWKAQDGSNRTKLRVMVENFEFIGDRASEKKDIPPVSGKNPAYDPNYIPPNDNIPY